MEAHYEVTEPRTVPHPRESRRAVRVENVPLSRRTGSDGTLIRFGTEHGKEMAALQYLTLAEMYEHSQGSKRALS